MRYFGVHYGHNSGVVVLDENGEIVFYGECERFGYRPKNHGFDLSPIIQTFPDLKPEKGDTVVVTSIGENLPSISGYDPFLVRGPGLQFNILDKPFTPQFVIDHHLAHAITAWCYRDSEDEKLFLAYDGAGSSASGKMKYSLVGSIGPKGFSYYDDAIHIPTSIPLSSMLGYGSAGKLMGMASYFDPPEFSWNDENFFKYLELTLDHNNHCSAIHPYAASQDSGTIKFLGGFYKWLTNLIWIALEGNIRKYANGRGIAIGGGSALALEVNTKLQEITGDVTFAPQTSDSGLALGGAAFGFFHNTKTWPKVNTPSVMSLQSSLPQIGPQKPKGVAKKIMKGPVALIRGKAEAGPRALGHRSILASATDYQNHKRVSMDLKGREYYRPLAPMVTEESFDRYFEGPKGKYMQYRVVCKPEAQKFLPAIVHKDLSARPQVVTKEDDPWLHSMLYEYGRISGHECIINTSLNGQGQPICNTYEDVQKDMEEKNIEIISIPEDK